MAQLKSRTLRNGNGARYLNEYIISRYGKYYSNCFYRVSIVTEALQVIIYDYNFKTVAEAEEMILSGEIEEIKKITIN